MTHRRPRIFRSAPIFVAGNLLPKARRLIFYAYAVRTTK